MCKVQYKVKRNYYHSIELYIDHEKRATFGEKQVELELAFGGGIPEKASNNTFMASALMATGNREYGFYCKLVQRTIVESSERPTERMVEEWVTKEQELLYQLLRQKALLLLSSEEGLVDFLPCSIANS